MNYMSVDTRESHVAIVDLKVIAPWHDGVVRIPITMTNLQLVSLELVDTGIVANGAFQFGFCGWLQPRDTATLNLHIDPYQTDVSGRAIHKITKSQIAGAILVRKTRIVEGTLARAYPVGDEYVVCTKPILTPIADRQGKILAVGNIIAGKVHFRE